MSADDLLSGPLSELADLAAETARKLEGDAARYAGWVRETLRAGGTLLFAGNGGSAATTQHVVAEYVVRFRRHRRPLAALALTSSTPVLSAAANDFGFEEVFVRTLRAVAGEGDLLVVHSTSGDSENLVRAVREAREMDIRTVGLLAGDGGRLAGIVDLPLVVPTGVTARAQELHMAIEHAVADRVDAEFAGPGGGGIP